MMTSDKNPLEILSKFPMQGTNIFTTMNQVATSTEAINLAQGFPNFACSSQLVDLVTKYMKEGYNQYPPMPGIEALRERISQKVESIYQRVYCPADEVTITPGGHAALNAAIAAVVNDGDEVIIFEPAFDCFRPIVELCGGVPVIIEMQPPKDDKDWSIDWDEVADCVSDRTRAIVINTPHNPTGSVLMPEDIQSLIEVTRNTRIVVISDEVYEHIIFDGLEHQSVCAYPELVERSFAIFSFGKVYHTTGWKVAYCLAPRTLMSEFRKIFQMTVFCTNHPIQSAIAEFMSDESRYLSLPDFYQAKRDLFLEKLEASRFRVRPASGTYFQSFCYQGVLEGGDMEVAKKIAADFKVAAIPMSAFFSNKTDYNFLRFCFAKTPDVIEEAGSRLCQV